MFSYNQQNSTNQCQSDSPFNPSFETLGLGWPTPLPNQPRPASRQIISRTIWSEWTWTKMIPFCLDAGCPISTLYAPIIFHLLLWHYRCNYGIWLVLHWHVKYETTKLLGGSVVFQKTAREPARKSRETNIMTFLIPQNKHPGITKILDPCKYWTVTIKSFV